MLQHRRYRCHPLLREDALGGPRQVRVTAGVHKTCRATQGSTTWINSTWSQLGYREECHCRCCWYQIYRKGIVIFLKSTLCLELCLEKMSLFSGCLQTDYSGSMSYCHCTVALHVPWIEQHELHIVSSTVKVKSRAARQQLNRQINFTLQLVITFDHPFLSCPF